ncbi:MAG TPA: ComEC/Rec2 family competence protein, partial [Thermoanaerobaculia bacterium]|nr:ComEC/Rec2 family competence protein [Thermoanaerobaculia bacterium]
MIRPIARRGSAPLLAGAAFFGAGVWAGGWSVAGTGLAAAAAALSLVALLRRDSGGQAWAAVFAMCCGFAAGRARVARPAERAEAAGARVDLDRPARIVGVLEDFWTGPDDRRRTRMRAETVSQGGAEEDFPAEIDVRAFGAAPLPGNRGDRVALTVSLEPPEDSASTRDLPVPGRVWRGVLKSGWQVRVVGTTATGWAAKVNSFLARRLRAARLPRETVQEPVAALLLGRTGELDREAAARIRQGGFSHVLLASGLQVALFAAILSALLRALRVRRRARDAVLLAGIAAFALVAGAGPSVVRMALTLFVLLLARLRERPVTVFQAIGASALVVLAAEPAELWRFGFWMTYAASLAIAGLTRPIAESLRFLPDRVRLAVAVTAAAQIGTAPLMLWRFNAASAAAWVVAPVGLPAAAALMALGGLVLGAAAAGLPAAIPGAAFDAAYRATAFAASRLRGATLFAVTPPFAAILALLVLAGAVAALSGRRRAVAAAAYAALFAALALRGKAGLRPAEFSVEALDVGQGDAFLMRSGDSAFLVDGGGGFSGAEDFGRARLLPKLLDRGIRSLDGVVLSHPHPDHAAGIFDVLRDLRVRAFFHGDGEDAGELFARLDREARSCRVPVRILRTGERLPWGGGEFRVLRSGGRPFKKDPINNESVVLLYVHGRRRVLLTGDAGEPAESEILSSLPSPPRVDILKVGHHGSRTSSRADFVGAFAPRAALLSCGRRNRFHHPAPETLATF